LDSSLEQIFVSVICATYNGEQKLPGLLEVLRANLIHSRFGCEVIFVIDGSNDMSTEILESFADANKDQNIKVLRNPSNLGISHSRNVGIAAAQGEILAFLDDDCRPNIDWLNLLSTYWHDAPASIVGVGGFVVPSKVASFNQRFCAATQPLRPFPGNHHNLNVLQRLRKYYSKPSQSFSTAEYLVGANMSFRRAAILQVGNFPRAIRFGGDDLYICQSLRTKFGDDCLTILASLVMPHEFPMSFEDSLRRSFRYGIGLGGNFRRGDGGLSVNPGPILLFALFVMFLIAVANLGNSARFLQSGAFIFFLSEVAAYSFLVAKTRSTQKHSLIENLKLGFAFLLCECANTIGFFSASRFSLRKSG